MGNQPSLTAKQYESHRSQMNLGKESGGDTKNSKLVKEKFLIAYNMRNRKVLQSFTSDGATFSFKGGDACLPMDLFIEQIESIQDSFPDVYITWDECIEVQPGVVKVTNFYSRGTHTGKPYSFGQFPAIPTSGKVVEEGPSHLVFLVENGKYTHFEVEAPPGDVTGPPGYYQKIGGKMTMDG